MNTLKILSASAAVALSLAANATTFYVSPDGKDTNAGQSESDAFLTPQRAFVFAKENDTVILAPGTYTMSSQLNIGKNNSQNSQAGLTLMGATGNPRDVVLDFQGTQRGVHLTSGIGITVSSLTVSNGMETVSYLNAATGIDMGGSQERTSETPNIVTNCVITCCGHIHSSRKSSLLVDANARAIDCLITGNTNQNASVSGAVVLLNGGELVNCIVEGNTGPGVSGEVDNGTNATGMVMRDCTVRNNDGNGVVNVLNVRDSRIEGNRANRGAGLFYNPDILKKQPADFRVTVSNTCFFGNVATTNSSGQAFGGAMAWGYLYSTISNLVVDSCQFLSNRVECLNNAGGGHEAGGGAVYIGGNWFGDNIVFRNSLFEGNVQSGLGNSRPGAAMVAVRCTNADVGTGKVRIENCTFVGNRNESGSANSVFLTGACADKGQIAYVTNCVFASNLKVVDGVETEVAGLETKAYALDHSYLYPASTTTYGDTVINGTKAPKFQEGTWIPSGRSPMRDAGVLLPWMVGAKDLQRDADGQAIRDRVLGSAPDMGCFEYYPIGMLFMVR